MTVLADTSIWIDHFRRTEPPLVQLLDRSEVVMHPFVLGELALGHVPGIGRMIDDLSRLPQATTASANEVLKFIVGSKIVGTRHRLCRCTSAGFCGAHVGDADLDPRQAVARRGPVAVALGGNA